MSNKKCNILRENRARELFLSPSLTEHEQAETNAFPAQRSPHTEWLQLIK